MDKICKKALLSERFEMDNSADAGRCCEIAAVVTVESGKVTRVERGRVALLGQADGSAAGRVADFDRLFGSRLNVRFGQWEGHDNSEVLAMVEDFIAACEPAVAV